MDGSFRGYPTRWRRCFEGRSGTRWQQKGSFFGADRWVDDAIWELALTRTMRKMLEGEAVPDGTVLSIPAEYDPSPVRRALMDLGMIDAPSLDDIPVVDLMQSNAYANNLSMEKLYAGSAPDKPSGQG